LTGIADAIDDGRIGGRLWFYANYHCNLRCTYCLTESAPGVERRLLAPEAMVERALEARELGFTALGVTGGEPFLLDCYSRGGGSATSLAMVTATGCNPGIKVSATEPN